MNGRAPSRGTRRPMARRLASGVRMALVGHRDAPT
jgi:hypothetical protein